ncbi:MAG: ATP-binding protein, partial [Candidatus Thermoplasmatota archaeon]|nr:ATP-binding protein [Candidatus Thermoplasmatota archaeon]
TFCSYGSVNTRLHYYAPRRELVDRAYTQLLGDPPAEGGHYITVWAPRQAGKTWTMQQVLWRLQEDERFDVLKIDLEHLKEEGIDGIVQYIAQEIVGKLGLERIVVGTLKEFHGLFQRGVLDKPLILILDEFDALKPEAIGGLASVFRNVYNVRRNEGRTPTDEKSYLLHGLALIGVRAVLGVENQTGSPFNVQRSMYIPNLTAEEVEAMFRWYERESGQEVEQAVIDRVFHETQGQPGLVSWLGELLTETYNHHPTQPLEMRNFDEAYSAAINVLPNNNILNIVSKAKRSPYREVVLKMFRAGEPMLFRYDNPRLNFLYMNGVVAWERGARGQYYVKFPSPFVQKRLFNYFTDDLFEQMERVYEPFTDLSDTITEDSLSVENLLRRYGAYLRENREWLLKDAPRRADLRPYEAVYHFGLYMYLSRFLQHHDGQVWPEFPTGNGKIDLRIEHAGRVYGLEVKSFASVYEYRKALGQAARYGKELELEEITLAFFVETIDDASRAKYEVVYDDADTGVTVTVVFVATDE